MAESSFQIIDDLIEEYIAAKDDLKVQEPELSYARSDVRSQIESDIDDDKKTIKRSITKIKEFSEEDIERYKSERNFEIDYMEYDLEGNKYKSLSGDTKNNVEGEILKIKKEIAREKRKLNILDEMYYDLLYEEDDFDDQSPGQGSMSKRP